MEHALGRPLLRGGRTIPYDQDSVRIPPVVAATCSTPPDVFQRIHDNEGDDSVTPSLSSWHNDPPQEVRALLQNQLHDALPFLVILIHLAVTLSQLRTCPRFEPVTVHQVRPVARFSRPNRLTHQSATQTHIHLIAKVRAPACMETHPASCHLFPTAPLLLLLPTNCLPTSF